MWDAWWDLVHGSSCLVCARPGRLLCLPCEADLPRRPQETRPDPAPPGLVRCFSVGEYADPLRTLILRHKEHSAFALARPLGDLLAVAAWPIAARWSTGPGLVVLVPVPSRGAVVRARGHDPVLRMTRVASSRLRAWGVRVVVRRLLTQRLRPEDQAGLTARDRSLNLRDTVMVTPAARRALSRSGSPVVAVLCDDVLTTGATARESQRALQDAGVQVGAVVTVAATRRRHGGPA